jgi:RND family efflux transporter MFP subunit
MNSTLSPSSQSHPGHDSAGGIALAGDAASEHPAAPSHVPTRYSPNAGRMALLFAVAVLIALTAIFVVRRLSNGHQRMALIGELNAAAGRMVTIDVIHVRAAPAERTLTLPGEARPFVETTVFARTNGYVEKYFVDIGDRVKEGQVLATLEAPELDDQIIASKAKVDELKAEVHVAQTNSAFAKTSFDRWELSTQDGAVSVQERDQKKAELDSSLAKLEAANAEVALAEADLRRLTTLDKFKVVTAPFEGTITERQVDLGDLVTAGSTTNTTPLFTIAQSNQMRVLVDVPQVSANDVSIGMPATASVGGRRFAGRVDRTAEAINLSSRTLRVEVLIPNPTHALLPGTYLQVTLQFDRPQAPLQVPASALVWRPKGPQVAIITDDGVVKFADVTILRDSGDVVEVGGLHADQRVALNIGSQAVEGDHVNVRDVDLPPPAKPAAPTVAQVNAPLK